MPFATSPERTVDGTFTGNQYTFDLYCAVESSSPEEEISDEDCNSNWLSFTCFTLTACECAGIVIRRNRKKLKECEKYFFMMWKIRGRI